MSRPVVPSLAGGVSQQPPQVRFPNQVEDASNIMFSASDHCTKRPGTRHLYELSGAPAANANVRLRAIDRSEDEQYLLTVQNNGTLRAFQLIAGYPEATINLGSGVAAYLASGSPTADDFRMVTIADSTIIVNTKVATGSTTSDSYTVSRTHRDYQAMVAHTPTDATYHRAIEDLDGLPGGYFKYDVGGITFGKWTFLPLSSTWFNLDTWRATANNPFGLTIFFQAYTAVAAGTATFNNATKELTATVGTPFADVLAYGLPNGQIRITGGTAVVADSYPIAAVNSSTKITLFDSIAGGGSPVDVSFTGIGIEYEFSVDLRNYSITDMTDVAQAIQDALRTAGAADALVSYEGGAGGAGAGGYFVITGPFRGSQSTVLVAAAGSFSPSAGSVDLSNAAGEPFNGGSATAGSGTAGATYTLSPTLRWTAVAAPSQSEAKLDPAKMPVRMTRTSAGDSFTPAVFAVSQIAYTQRLQGDKVTNPVPAFITAAQPIDDVSYHRGRLVFLAGEHLAFSQADDLFNFFRDAKDQTVDSDPINLHLSSDRVTLGRHLASFRKSLAVFTRAGQQFEVVGNDTLTPTNASVVPTVSHYTQSVRPVVLDNLLYAVGSEAARGQLLELFYDDAAVTTLPSITSSHVPRLLPASVRTLAGHANSKTVFAIGSDGRSLYSYRTFWNGNQKQLSSWTTYTLASGNRIADIAVSRDRLYLLIDRSGVYVVESLAVTREDPDTSGGTWAYEVYLDRREYASGSFGGGNTTWTLNQTTSGLDCVVLGPAFGASSGTVLTPTTPGAHTVRVAGDYSAGTVAIGRLYPVSLTLTRPFVRDDQDEPDLDWIFSIQKVTVGYRSSGAFTIRSAPGEGRADRTYAFSPTTTLASGEFAAGAFGPADKTVVSIESTDARPLQIAGVQWEGIATR